MKSYVFKVELEEDPESGLWSAAIPALPGCAVDATSPEEALGAIREAAEAYLSVLKEDGRSLPSDDVIAVFEGAAVTVSG